MPKKGRYLLDVFYLACTAFGGPQAHISMMLKLFVQRRGYLTERELIETFTFCQMLPGPGSTQTVIAVSYKRGGLLLAIVSFLIWIMPATVLMTMFSLLLTSRQYKNIPTDLLHFIIPMAVGFIAFAGFRIGKSIVKSDTGWILVAVSVLAPVLWPNPWVFPLVIIFSGLVTFYKSTDNLPHQPLAGNIKWGNVAWGSALFIGILILAAIIGGVTKYRPALLFENFYRFGALTFGGGQVMVPMMLEQFVNHRHYLTAQEFMGGYTLNQMVPGPTFSFTAFAGSMALKDMGWIYQIYGAIIATLAIYFPGFLLTILFFPLWEHLKGHHVLRRALEGLNAASTGLIFAAALIMLENVVLDRYSMSIMIATFCMLHFTKVPAPVLVICALLLGWVSHLVHAM